MVINKGRHFRRPICVNIFREACILDGSTLEKRPSPSLSLHSAETQPPLYKFVHISHRGSAQRRQPPQRGPRGGGTQRRRLAWREPRGGGATPRNRGCASPQCQCSQQRNSSGRGDLMAVWGDSAAVRWDPTTMQGDPPAHVRSSSGGDGVLDVHGEWIHVKHPWRLDFERRVTDLYSSSEIYSSSQRGQWRVQIWAWRRARWVSHIFLFGHFVRLQFLINSNV